LQLLPQAHSLRSSWAKVQDWACSTQFLQAGSKEVTQVKQYLVMKMVQGLDKVAGLMALPGFYTLEAAQQFVAQASAQEPGSTYVIQEVGAA
jgi:hypothetical protein